MAHHECLPVPYFWGYFTTSQPVLSTLNNKIYLGHRERLPVRPLRPQPQLKPGPEPKPVKRKTAPVGGKCVVFWINCIFKRFWIYNTRQTTWPYPQIGEPGCLDVPPVLRKGAHPPLQLLRPQSLHQVAQELQHQKLRQVGR